MAHAYTIEECNKLGLKVERFEEGSEYYTNEAQDIFNRHFDFIENNLLNDCICIDDTLDKHCTAKVHNW